MRPYNVLRGQKIQTDAGVLCDHAFIAHFQVAASLAVAASDTGVHAGVILQEVVSSLSVNLTNPATPRALRIKGDTAGIVGDVVIEGTNVADEVIAETIIANGVAVVEGVKAFKTITRIVFPVRNAEGDQIAIGWNDKLGLPYKLTHNTVLKAYHDNALEGTAATVTVSTTAIESNTIDLNTALNSKVVDVYLMV